MFPASAVEAVILSPAVGEQFQVDAFVRRFVISDPKIDSTGFSSLQGNFCNGNYSSKIESEIAHSTSPAL
jgi:hypothetical protein